jgi:hypothetical protein
MPETYEVFTFPDEFDKILTDEGKPHSIPLEEACRKPQVQYLKKYLGDKGCGWILLEKEYVDHDYLDDYATYYSKCFVGYKRLCKRAHFWRSTFMVDNLDRLVSGEHKITPSELRKSYIGFTIIRPLPDAIIGRTVLEPYDPVCENGAKRSFDAKRSYHANLFGLKLSMESLASQEQDTVLAACATAALWSAFQKTGLLFETYIPTPSEITHSATRFLKHTRPVPTRGLSVEQICNAISENRLVPEVFEVSADVPVNSLIYSYLKGEIPVILGYQIAGTGDMHAVTVVGYRIESGICNEQEATDPLSDLNMIGRRISEFYVHDDNLGPFSSLKSMESDTLSPDALKDQENWQIEYVDGRAANKRIYQREFDLPSWKKIDCCIPAVVVVPLYHKIRLKFTDIREIAAHFDGYFRALGIKKFGGFTDNNIEWDLRLSQLGPLKDWIKACTLIDRATKATILYRSLPRFNWIATAKLTGKPILSLICDATNIKRSFFIEEMLIYYETVRESLKKAIEKDSDRSIASECQVPIKLVQFIRDRIL